MHAYHKRLHRIFPSNDLAAEARVALNGAGYHFDKTKELLRSSGMSSNWEGNRELDAPTRNRLGGEVNQFHWHLRAFFWELVATFDTLLQWANQRYELGVKEREVTWTNIQNREAKKNHAKWKTASRALNDAWQSAWYFEVRGYRNFAHTAFLINVAALNPDKGGLVDIGIRPVREGQPEFVSLVDQLSGYGKRMTELLNNVLGK